MTKKKIMNYFNKFKTMIGNRFGNGKVLLELKKILEMQRKISEQIPDVSERYNTRICPICQTSSKKFRNFGEKPRPNAQCPKCGSLERHRLLWLFLSEKTEIFWGDKKILHFAPEKCMEERIRVRCGANYHTADMKMKKVDMKIDIQDTKIKEGTYDYIVCSHVLEHVPDDRKAIAEIRRILKPGGYGILLVPIRFSNEQTIEDETIVSPEDRFAVYGQSDHLRLYGMDFESRLKDSGFHVEAVNYCENFDSGVKEIFRLPAKELIFLCRK